MKGKHNRGVAQLASASGLGPEGPVFESQYPDIKRLIFGSAFFILYKIDKFALLKSLSGCTAGGYVESPAPDDAGDLA